MIIDIGSAQLVISGGNVLPRILTSPEFELEILSGSPGLNDNDLSGHWHLGIEDDPEWDFNEQVDLPIPYHKHPTRPHVCGHWHKRPIYDIPCIDWVASLEINPGPHTAGLYNTADVMISHSDNFMYAADRTSGTIFRFSSLGALSIERTRTFADADISGFKQLLVFNNLIYALVARDGYIGNWIQKISFPVSSSDNFELVDDPLYVGTVVYGTDGNVYGAMYAANMIDFWETDRRPITGSWTGVWELLPSDYPHHIYLSSQVAAGPSGTSTVGAKAINFQTAGSSAFIINCGPESGTVSKTSKIAKITTNGEREYFFGGDMTIGPNELVKGPTGHEFAALRCIGSFGNLTLRYCDSSSGDSSDTLITGLIDVDGDPYDGAIYHKRTIWNHGNNRVYNLHSTYPDTWGRIISVDPRNGTLLHQYIFDGALSLGSFAILGDHVFVWQNAVADIWHQSWIVKLTLDLEFVCTVPCIGLLSGAVHYEEGRAIISDGNEFIFNFAVNSGAGNANNITKYQVNPINITSDDHDPRWEFDKQDNVD